MAALTSLTREQLIEIGLMKCDAIISRGSRKDFYDLFYILRYIRLDDLLKMAEQKYAMFRDFPLMFLESMITFDNADRDGQPDLFEKIPWEEIKRFSSSKPIFWARFGSRIDSLTLSHHPL